MEEMNTHRKVSDMTTEEIIKVLEILKGVMKETNDAYASHVISQDNAKRRLKEYAESFEKIMKSFAIRIKPAYDEKVHFAPRNDNYTHPVFAIDSKTASRLTVQLESEKKEVKIPALTEKTNRKELILGYVEDLIGSLLYYDRKDDEDLRKGEIEEAVEKGEITANDIAERFRSKLFEKLSIKK